jgi:aryl-alcohol dehydrogenase-like predicted oxidoreductase
MNERAGCRRPVGSHELCEVTDAGIIPALRHLGVGLIPYSPLHAGLLAGARVRRQPVRRPGASDGIAFELVV